MISTTPTRSEAVTVGAAVTQAIAFSSHRDKRLPIVLLVPTRQYRGLFLCVVLLIRFLLLTSLIPSVHGCLKSSIYYRSKARTRSHVFAPGEYQPRQWEHTAEASGPLDVRDFQHTIPSKRLVRVNSPHIMFDSEEARWMTKGCRDRLLKLSTQIQNTWAKQDVILRVNRAWIQPPPQYKTKPVTSNDAAAAQETDDNVAAESLLYNRNSVVPESQTTSHVPLQQTVPTAASAPIHRPAGIGRTQSAHNAAAPSIIDMTPEMMVDDNRPDLVEQTSSSRSQPMNIRYDYLSPVPKPSPIPSKWSSVQSFRYASPSNSPLARFDRSYIQQSPLRYYPTETDTDQTGRPFRNPGATKMMRLPRHVRAVIEDKNDTRNSESNKTRVARKVGRSVYSLPIPLDTGYTSVNRMSQLAFEQWLQMRMEEFHYAGRAVDVQLVSRAGYINMRNPEFSLGVLAQIAYYVAQFDWCYFSRSGHVHCSVKPDASITSQWFGCFPASAKFHLDTGKSVTVDQLKVGDHVLSQNTDTGEFSFTPVVAFLHRDEHAWSPMVRIIYTVPQMKDYQNRSLYLTPDHLVYIKPEGTGPIQTVFASSLRQGSTIITSPIFSNQSLSEGLVLQTEYITKFQIELIGLYAPLTQTGSVIVDGVVVSCFAHVSNPYLSYVATWPLQWMYKVNSWMHMPEVFDTTRNGIHWFAKLLLHWLTPILPSTVFYPQT